MARFGFQTLHHVGKMRQQMVIHATHQGILEQLYTEDGFAQVKRTHVLLGGTFYEAEQAK